MRGKRVKKETHVKTQVEHMLTTPLNRGLIPDKVKLKEDRIKIELKKISIYTYD